MNPLRRFQSPERAAVPAEVFQRPPLLHWQQYADWLVGADWPPLAALNAAWPPSPDLPRFAAQTPQLLADGLHYETRIAERGLVATRENNWHDLFNALIWLRYPALKAALNARYVAEIALVGTKLRSRAQCALTHFDEAGAIVVLRDPALLALWDAHDWPGLFWRERATWHDRIDVHVFGHALLEHALVPQQLFVAKALVIVQPAGDASDAVGTIAQAVRAGVLLNDPQELRPLPLSGIPGWHADNADERFYRQAPCFRSLRPGRVYPAPLR